MPTCDERGGSAGSAGAGRRECTACERGAEWAGVRGGGAQPHLVPWPSQPERRLVGAASGRQTRPRALRQALETTGEAAMPCRRPAWLEQGHVVEVQRTPRDRRFIIRTNNHSFRGLIAAALPPFPGQRLPKPSNLNFICDPRNTRAPSSTGDGFNCVSPFHVCEDFGRIRCMEGISLSCVLTSLALIREVARSE